MGAEASSNKLGFLAGDGEMGALIRSYDWAATPAGPPEFWPQALKTTLRIMLASRHPMFLWWGEALTCFYNDAYSALIGLDRHPSALGQPGRKVWAEIWDVIGPQIDLVMTGQGATWHERQLIPITRGDQREDVWWTYGYSPVDDDDAITGVGGVLVICRDVTTEVRAEQAHANEAERLRQFFEQAPGFMALLRGPHHVFELTNAAYQRLVGREVLGKSVRDALPEVEDQGFFGLLDKVYATGTPFTARRRPLALASGPSGTIEQSFLDFVYQPVRDAAGVVTGIFVEGSDVTEAKLTEEALRASEARLREVNAMLEQRVQDRTTELRVKEARLRTIFETSYQYQGLLALDGTLLDANATSLEGIASKLADVVGKPFWDTPWFTGTPGMAQMVRTEVSAAAAGEAVRREISVNLPTGRRSFDFTVRPMRDADGRVVAVVPEAVDITERREAEEQLRQAQKMEAVGQLTGGIAHDFNNLLTGISGSLELLKSRLAQGRLGDVERYITASQGAANRAAALTHRLLAFSRRQILDAKPIQANRLVGGIEEMIRRTVGPAIEVETVSSAGLWPTLCDPNQLENALLNLCINARDAMPDGGRLTIETANTRLDERGARERDMAPGHYVAICVTDTGSGMPPHVVARVFDPFFTTKPLGMGTGLGLSMIYGFTRQSGGQVRISSEMGRGTTVRLYLPRHRGKAEGDQAPVEHAEAPRAETGETVLVVDDESTVRMLVIDVLEELGYVALEAADSASALKMLQSDGRIDLLIADVGLPGGMNGRQVADAARQVRPDLKVLFITGYAENAVVGNGHLAPGMQVMVKPFAMESLASRIKALIAGG
jgi:PAS domain S-box-containing protein